MCGDLTASFVRGGLARRSAVHAAAEIEPVLAAAWFVVAELPADQLFLDAVAAEPALAAYSRPAAETLGHAALADLGQTASVPGRVVAVGSALADPAGDSAAVVERALAAYSRPAAG